MENVWLEPAVRIFKEHFGNTANIIIDVGTRDGDDAEYFRQELNGKEVYAIDANPLAVALTKSNYPNFNIFETAVSDFDGETSFEQILADDKDQAGCSSIVRIHNFEGVDNTAITVPVIRLDTFFKNNNLNDKVIDIIKVDVEGFSYEVIVGMGNQLQNVKLFHLETETFKRHDDHKDHKEIRRFMTKNNFLLKDLSYEWGPLVEDQVWINQKFM
jgi:FkbM family methyltransferase